MTRVAGAVLRRVACAWDDCCAGWVPNRRAISPQPPESAGGHPRGRGIRRPPAPPWPSDRAARAGATRSLVVAVAVCAVPAIAAALRFTIRKGVARNPLDDAAVRSTGRS